MTRSELIKRLKQKYPDLYIKDVVLLVDTFFDRLTGTLKTGGRVELRGFGSFSIREREAREARNPKTGEKVKLGSRNVVYFRAGKGLKKRLNDA